MVVNLDGKRKEKGVENMLYRNLNEQDCSFWTREDMEQLRDDEAKQGLYVEDSFEEWLSDKLESDFEEVQEKEKDER